MRRLILPSVFLLSLLYIVKLNDQSELVFLGQDAYEEPVYKDMLLLPELNLIDAEAAFNAYNSTHDLTIVEQKKFLKRLKKMKPYADKDGNFISTKQRLAANTDRNPTPNPDYNKTAVDVSQTSFAMDIPNVTSLGNWKQIGPFGEADIARTATGNGALQYVKMHPTDAATMFVCARNGGLWKTEDYGNHWELMTGHFATPNTSCIDVCIDDADVMYLGSEDDGIVWYTDDAGTNWSNRSTGLSGEIFEIISDPNDAAKALVATNTGLYYTTDSGMSWMQKIAGEFADIDWSSDFNFIMVSKDDSDTASSLWFSKDRGVTWIEESIVTTPATVDKFLIAMSEPVGKPIQVFAYGMEVGNTPTRFIGLWKSNYDPTPSGSNHFDFQPIQHPTYAYPSGPVPLRQTVAGFDPILDDGYGGVNPYTSSQWISDFWVSPNDTLRLATMREKLWGSDDGGILWDEYPSYGESNWADNKYMTMNTAKDTIFWCNDGGLWAISESDMYPTDAVVTASGLTKKEYRISKVISKNGNICVTESENIDISPLNKGVYITGGQDLGQMFVRNGKISHVGFSDVYRGRIKPTDDKLYVTGEMWVNIDGSATISKVYDAVIADKGNADRIYGYTRTDEKLVRSPAGVDGWLVENFTGENQSTVQGAKSDMVHSDWETVSLSGTGIVEQNAFNFEQSWANPELAFVADEINGTVWKTENLSSATPTWTQLSSAVVATSYRIATHPLNENLITLATNEGIFISKDGGQSWVEKTGYNGTAPERVLMDKNLSEAIYIMTRTTIYYTDESLESWEPFDKGLPLQENRDIKIAYYSDGDARIYVGKYGTGAWMSPLQSTLQNTNDLPIADFAIHGLSSSNILVGEEVQLVNHSSNYESISWTLTNGADVINIGNEEAPISTLNTAGYYEVSLTATNDNGSDTKTVTQYITVNAPSSVNCTAPFNEVLLYYKGFDNIGVGGDIYDVKSLDNTFNSNYVFGAKLGEATEFYFNDNGSDMYVKAWIDYNADGDFDDMGEEIATTGGNADNFTTIFTPPTTALTGQLLRMRVSGNESNIVGEAPTPCQDAAVYMRQHVDFHILLSNLVEFTSTSSVTGVTEATISTTYTGANTVSRGGFLLTQSEGDLTINNGDVFENSNLALSNDDLFSEMLTGLELGRKYYYRPYVYDATGIHYGAIESFTLEAAKMPLSTSVIALNEGADEWTLIGKVYPEGNDLTTVYIQHGESSFANSTAVELDDINADGTFNVATLVTVPAAATSYKFRVKVTFEDKDYFSNIYTFEMDQSICVPTVNAPAWFKRYNKVQLLGTTHTEPSGEPAYEDVTSVSFDLESGSDYTMVATYVLDSWKNLDFNIYIDLNNDGDFDDFGELVGVEENTPDQNVDILFSIPTFPLVTQTDLRMRVVGYENSPSDVCNIGIGNIKDFTVHIDRCEEILTLDINDLPFINNKVYKASQEIRLQNDLDVGSGVKVTFDAPVIKVENKLEQTGTGIIIAKPDGCED